LKFVRLTIWHSDVNFCNGKGIDFPDQEVAGLPLGDNESSHNITTLSKLFIHVPLLVLPACNSTVVYNIVVTCNLYA